MTTRKQDDEFRDALIDNDLLEKAIEWISQHVEPEEVFNDTELATWARNNGYTLEE